MTFKGHCAYLSISGAGVSSSSWVGDVCPRAPCSCLCLWVWFLLSGVGGQSVLPFWTAPRDMNPGHTEVLKASQANRGIALPTTGRPRQH